MDDLSLARAGGTGAPVRAATANEDLMHDPCTMSRIPSTDKTANKEPRVPMTSATEVGTKHSHPVRPSQAGLTEPAEGRALSQLDAPLTLARMFARFCFHVSPFATCALDSF